MTLVPYIELLLGVYFTFMAYYALSNDIFGTLPFILLFQVGFLYAGFLSLIQNLTGLEMREQEA